MVLFGYYGSGKDSSGKARGGQVADGWHPMDDSVTIMTAVEWL